MNPNRLGFGYAMLMAFLLVLPSYASPFAAKKSDSVQLQAALDGTGSDVRETNLGDLVADAVRQSGQAEIALIPADEITSNIIPAGSIPASQIVQALRYGDDGSDTVTILNLTGAQVLKAVERAVSRAPQGFNGFLQVSGLQIRYDASVAEGKRVGLVGAGGSELSATKTYKVVTTRSLADGGLGYFQIWDKKDIISNTGVTIAASLTNYLSNHKTIAGSLEGRITANH